MKVNLSDSTAEKILNSLTNNLDNEAPNVSDSTLEEMIDIAVESGNFETVWNLALNYNYRLKDKSKLVDFVIDQKVEYYITEFLNGGFIGIDRNKLLNAYSYFLTRH